MIDNKVFAVGIVALLVIGGMFAVNFLVVNDNDITGAAMLSYFKVKSNVPDRTTLSPVLGPCTYDSDCRDGYYCRPYYTRMNERCVLGKALVSQQCNQDSDCGSGLYCDMQRGTERTQHTFTCIPVTTYG